MENIENQERKIEDQSIHEKFVEYGKNVKEWMRKCALLLPEIERCRIWDKKGFSSLYEYAAKLAGMSRYQVNESLRVLRKTEDKPELRKVIEEKGINSVKPVVAIATRENEEFWAAKVRKMSKNTLEVYVREFKKQQGFPRKSSRQKEFFAGEVERKVVINMELSEEIADQLQKLKGSNDWKDLMREFLELREEKLRRKYLGEEKNIRSNGLYKAKSRAVPAKIKKFVVAATSQTCAFPGCTKSYDVLHHTKRFALNHCHDPEYIVPLCKEHHMLVHLGLIENEEKPMKYWKIRKEADKYDFKRVIDERVLEFRGG